MTAAVAVFAYDAAAGFMNAELHWSVVLYQAFDQGRDLQ
jgi:hypothetical protein